VSELTQALQWLWSALEKIPATFWSDVAKSLLGSFVGAGLAFWYALRRDAIVRRRDQKAAGNFAMAIIGRQLSDFLVVKKGIDEHRREVQAVQPNTPLWMGLKPIQIEFSQGLTFDLRSLDFLFESGGTGILEKLINAELSHRDLVSLVEVHRSTAERAQEKLAAANIGLDVALPIGQFEQILGIALVAKLRDFTAAIFDRIDKGDAVYFNAGESLHNGLVAVFGKKGVIRVRRPDNVAGVAPPNVAQHVPAQG
jgi:hypothetical protein